MRSSVTKQERKPRLAFHTPDFLPGVNVTVREGTRWFNHFHAEQVTDVVLLDGDGEVVGDATITAAYCMPFMQINPLWLLQQADKDLRTMDGCLFDLEEKYGEQVIDSYVTVLFYEVARKNVRQLWADAVKGIAS